jgi:hypothetical protein
MVRNLNHIGNSPYQKRSAYFVHITTLICNQQGLGAWAWGDALFWGYRPSEDEELKKVFDYAVAQVSEDESGCKGMSILGLTVWDLDADPTNFIQCRE